MLLSNYQKNSFYPFLPLSSCGVTKKRIVNESRKLLALKYFQDKLLLLGKAAELAGLSKWDFIEYLSENHVPVIDYDDDELTREFETAKTFDSRDSRSFENSGSLWRSP